MPKIDVLDINGKVVEQMEISEALFAAKVNEHCVYEAVQCAYGEIKEKNVNKPLKGHFKKAGVGSKRHLREFKVANIADYQLAGEINVDVFAVGDKVDAVATSKGKGFQGPIKRHGQ